MPFIIGVIFRKSGNIHYYNPGDISLDAGDRVICRIDNNATDIGEVIAPPSEIGESEFVEPVNKVLRKATDYDLSIEEFNRDREAEGVKKFEELTRTHGLSMKLVDVHVIFDKSKMIFYFTADKRVDFREMVKELASYFKIRIELRQIGVRDEAKIVGGLGPCGMNLCCKSFLTDFESISIKMAKDQNLPLNPLKISGICGRLMCCLNYEYNTYKEFLDQVPERGVSVKTKHGIGTVSGYNPLKKSVVVEFENENKITVPFSEIEVVEEASHIKTESLSADISAEIED
ncbi:MAG: stage 0 sporulation family protein [Actinobacteria bacterium]|nr:stage 0 sporulation family protein [Actinomycetota bacterium]MBM3712075.1 stage 0 sporulation family protein [Actinomycetota bacterium]